MEMLIGQDRVRAHTGEAVNRRIDREAQGRLDELRNASPVAIARRLGELDREWDIDRALMLLFSFVGALTYGLAVRSIKPFRKWNGWLYLLAAPFGSIGLHAAYGWCPPVPVLRRLGFRTHQEIDAERRSLEAMATDELPIRRD